MALETDDHSIACEITIETPGSREIGNIQKAIDAGFDKIILICPNLRKRRNLVALIGTHFASGPVPVICIPPGELESHLCLASTATTPRVAAPKTPRGFAVDRRFADGSDRKPISESEALESIARIMRPAKDDPA